MDSKVFETALVKKLSNLLDFPDQWTNSTLTSLKHKTENILILCHTSIKEVTLISPKRYDFKEKELSNLLFHKTMTIYKANEVVEKVVREDQTKKELIDIFGLDDRFTKLKRLEEVSQTMPDPVPLKPKPVPVPVLPEKELNLPKKKKKFWFF